MKIKFSSLLLFAVAALTACNVNLNLPRKNQSGTDVQIRWSAVVCSSKAKTVTLFAGRDTGDAESFAVWKEGAAQKVFDLPADLQGLSRIYLKAAASEKSRVEMCVLYDGKAKKRVEFDDEEDVHVNVTDVEGANKCRCTE